MESRQRKAVNLEKVYATREAGINDPELTNFFCPVCGAHVVCVDFVRQNSDKFICVGKCDNGDELFVRFKFTKRSDGKFRVSRIIYDMDEEKRAYYMSKKPQAEEAKAAVAV